jgi:glucose-1-phosphate cytidylyltransferase
MQKIAVPRGGVIGKRAGMKAVILAGGLGTRLAEETEVKPKPMVEIGGRPILWHIMKIYSAHGINDFVVCLGYKGYIIKEYLEKYPLHTSDVTFDMRNQKVTFHRRMTEPWTVTLIDTGEETMTGGRIKRALPYVSEDEAFCMTYGDGVGDIDIAATLALHKKENALCTVTAVRPPGRFGALKHKGSKITGMQEKPEGDGGWINGGFFVLSPKIGDFIEGDDTSWERQPMESLAAKGKMAGHFHKGFWHPMDTLRDKRFLESLWESGKAPWKIWKD